MLVIGDVTNRTGTKLDNENSPMEIEVVQKANTANIYLLQTQIKGESGLASGKYFVSGEQLEVMIVGYQTGLWLDPVTLNSDAN